MWESFLVPSGHISKWQPTHLICGLAPPHNHNFWASFSPAEIRGEREFPSPVIPGNTSLKFPFPFPGKGSFGRELRREIPSLFSVLRMAGQGMKINQILNLTLLFIWFPGFPVIPGITSLKFPFPSLPVAICEFPFPSRNGNVIFNFPSRSRAPKSLSPSPLHSIYNFCLCMCWPIQDRFVNFQIFCYLFLCFHSPDRFGWKTMQVLDWAILDPPSDLLCPLPCAGPDVEKLFWKASFATWQVVFKFSVCLWYIICRKKIKINPETLLWYDLIIIIILNNLIDFKKNND